MANQYGSADAAARVGPAGPSETAAVNAGQQRANVYTWTKVKKQQAEEAARKKKQQQTQTAAKNRIAAPSAPHAVAPVAPPAPPPTAKELLDAYRAMNNGALPPGVSEDMAALIDMGIDYNAIAGTNPMLANSMLQVEAQLRGLPAEYANAKNSVSSSYANLTGNVLNSGQQWMSNILGRMTDPANNANAGAVTGDPAIGDYAGTLGNIDATSKANQATDLAWFDKMQVNDANLWQSMLAQLAAQAALPVAPVKASGGGGGGGGGRHYGGGGGKGSGGGNTTWKTPTNTLTNQLAATDTAETVTTANSPGFYDDLIAQAEATGDPELVALFENLWNTSTQNARGVTQDTQKALNEAELASQNYDIKKGLHENWFQNTPNLAASAIGRLLTNNKGAVLGDDPNTPGIKETWHFPSDPNSNTPVVPRPAASDEETRQNTFAEELLGAQSKYPARQMTKQFFPKADFGLRPGVTNSAGLMEEKLKGAISPQQIAILGAQGAKDLSTAKTGIPGEDFDISNWAAGGGYVPGMHTDPAGALAETNESRERDKYRGFYKWILDHALPWNQNANFVPTVERLNEKTADSSTYKTSNTNKGVTNALPGSPLDLTPTLPNSAIASNPVSNPSGFNVTLDDNGNETVDPFSTEDTSDFGGIGLSNAIGMFRKPSTRLQDAALKDAAMSRMHEVAKKPAPKEEEPPARTSKSAPRTTSTSKDPLPRSTKAPLELGLAPGAHARRHIYVPKSKTAPAKDLTERIFGVKKPTGVPFKNPPKKKKVSSKGSNRAY